MSGIINVNEGRKSGTRKLQTDQHRLYKYLGQADVDHTRNAPSMCRVGPEGTSDGGEGAQARMTRKARTRTCTSRAPKSKGYRSRPKGEISHNHARDLDCCMSLASLWEFPLTMSTLAGTINSPSLP